MENKSKLACTTVTNTGTDNFQGLIELSNYEKTEGLN